MELKVWVDGFQRLVCGISQQTTCQEVIYALAHATGKTGRFVLVEKWRTSERSLSPHDKPLELLLKWGEYASDVQFVLRCLEDSVVVPQHQSQQLQSASVFTNTNGNIPTTSSSICASASYKASFINNNNNNTGNNNNNAAGLLMMNSDKTMVKGRLVDGASGDFYRANDDNENCRTAMNNPVVNRRITADNVPSFSSLNVQRNFDKISPPLRNTINEGGVIMHENYAVIQKQQQPGGQQNSFNSSKNKITNVVVLSHSAHENLSMAASSSSMNKHFTNNEGPDFNSSYNSQKGFSYSQQDSVILDSSDLSTLPSTTDSCPKKSAAASTTTIQNQFQDQNQPFLASGSAYNRKPVPPSPSITRACKNAVMSQKSMSAPNQQQCEGPGPSSQPIPASGAAVPFKGHCPRPPPPSYEEIMKQRRQNYAGNKSFMQMTPPPCSSTTSSLNAYEKDLAFCQNKVFVDRMGATENVEGPYSREQLFHLIESQQNVLETQTSKIRALDNLIDMEQLKLNELKKQQYEDSGNLVAELQRLETKHAQLKQTLDEMRLSNGQNLELDLIDLRRQNASLSIETKSLETKLNHLDNELSTKEKILDKILIEFEKEQKQKDEQFDDQKLIKDDQIQKFDIHNLDDDQDLLRELDRILREKKKKCEEIESKISAKESCLKFLPQGHLENLENRQSAENDVTIMPHLSQLIKETTPGVWV